jgi:type IV fimbrial biogenesis protein FimT
MSPSRPRGFSVVELSVVLAVISIVLAIGVPSFGRVFARSRVQAAGNELLVTLAQARMNAVTDQESWSLCPSRDGHACSGDVDWSDGWIVFRDPHERGAPAPADIVQHASHADGPRISGTAGRRVLSFRADGSSAGSNVTLLVCDREADVGRKVIVSNAGRARVAPLRDGDPACAH